MSELLDVIKPLLPLIAFCSLLVFLISLASLPWLVAKIPEDYFLHRKRKKTLPLTTAAFAHYLFLRLARNLVGLILLAGGFLMLFIPGQGVLTMVMGLILVDYPGKYSVEKAIIGYPAVFKGLNWLRAKAHKPPLRKHDS
jgi:archaellum biogenesis protein FlaJ (TadC family)